MQEIEAFISSGVECREELVEEVLRGNNVEEGTAMEMEELCVGEPAMLERDVAIAQKGIVGGGKFVVKGVGKNMRMTTEDGRVDGFEDWVGKIAGLPFVRSQLVARQKHKP